MSDLRAYASDLRSRGLSPRTISEYVRLLSKFDHLPLTLGEARQRVAERLDEVSAATVHMEVRALLSFHRWWAEEYEEPNPLAKLKAPKVAEPGKVSVATAEDVERLIKASQGPTFQHRRDRALVAVLWATGARRSEVAEMRLEDINLDQAVILLPRTKNGTGRIVPLDERACRALSLYLHSRDRHRYAHLDLVWLGEKGPLTSNGIGQALTELSKKAKVHVSPHSFRRGLAYRWLRNGGSETSLRAVCGWKHPAMPARYVRAVASELAIAEARRVL